MAALAGVLLAPTQTTGLNIEAMTLLVVNGYAAAIVGRLKNIPVTFAAAIGIGLARGVRDQLPAAPPAPEPGARRHRRPADGLLVHRPGHAALGAAAGDRAGSPRCERRGSRAAGSRSSPGVVFFGVAIVLALIFDNTAFRGTTVLDPRRRHHDPRASSGSPSCSSPATRARSPSASSPSWESARS